MTVNNIDGAIKSIELCAEDLELVVAAANIAGHMEKAEKIHIDNDAQLAKFCIKVVEQYYAESDLYPVFPEFVQDALIDEFNIENGEV